MVSTPAHAKATTAYEAHFTRKERHRQEEAMALFFVYEYGNCSFGNVRFFSTFSPLSESPTPSLASSTFEPVAEGLPIRMPPGHAVVDHVSAPCGILRPHVCSMAPCVVAAHFLPVYRLRPPLHIDPATTVHGILGALEPIPEWLVPYPNPDAKL